LVSAHFLENYLSRAFIFYMLIGFGDDMTPYDFEFTMSKVKVTLFLCKTMVFIPCLENYLRAFIFHTQTGLGEDMTPFDFELI